MNVSTRNRIAGAVICAVILTSIGIAGWLMSARPARIEVAQELPPIEPSPYLNTALNVAFVGMERCRKCHADAHASYAETAHSQALADLDLAHEPADGEFEDPHAQRHYRIHRQEGQLRHEESIRNGEQQKLILADWPVRYVIGSGRFSRSYLIENDGFLFESPATWYAAKPGWGLSPGYEVSNAGFQRAAEFRCLSCHAGRLESVDRSPQKITFHAQSVDCERCHGPGELHVKLHESRDSAPITANDRDTTIVNPSRLDRQRQEDICAQCHLQGAAVVELRGRNLHDFRPGQLLSDYVTHFAFQASQQPMEVVGHVEQLRLSRCYTSSDQLTCTTCHDPHGAPKPKAAVKYYRNQCLACHAEEACGQPHEMRTKSNPEDNCVSCHMPRGPTEIAHFAFTHHRIGIHGKQSAETPSPQPKELAILAGNPSLSELDQTRNLGLAYLQASDGPGQAPFATSHRTKALELLSRVRPQLKDTAVEAALARLHWGTDPYRTLMHANQVADATDAAPQEWATACYTLGTTYYGLNDQASAKLWLERTLQVTPNADVWIMYSDCLRQSGDLPGAVDAARRGSELAPDRPRYLAHYAELLGQTGKTDQAAQLQKRIQDLFHYRRRVDK